MCGGLFRGSQIWAASSKRTVQWAVQCRVGTGQCRVGSTVQSAHWAVEEIGISDVLDTFSDDGKWVVVC